MMAKSLVRNRHAVTKMYGLKSQLQAVSLRIAVRAPTVRGFLLLDLQRREKECSVLVCRALCLQRAGVSRVIVF